MVMLANGERVNNKQIEETKGPANDDRDEKEDVGFRLDDPSSLKGRPGIDDRWNTRYVIPDRRPSRSLEESPSMELDLTGFRKQTNIPGTSPETWFPKMTGTSALDVIAASAGPIDSVSDTFASRPQAPGANKLSTLHGVQRHSLPSRPSTLDPPDFASLAANNAMMMPLMTVGVGMMGSGGPMGYDASGTINSPDPNLQMQPETDRCFGLEETWLRQCAAPIQVYLELESTTDNSTIDAMRNNSSKQEDRKEFREYAKKLMLAEANVQLHSDTQALKNQLSKLQNTAESQRQMQLQMQAVAYQASLRNQNPNQQPNLINARSPQHQLAQQPVDAPPLPSYMRPRRFSNNAAQAVDGSLQLRLGPIPDSDFRASAPKSNIPSFMMNRPGSLISQAGESSGGSVRPLAPFDMAQTLNGMLSDITDASKVQVEPTDEQSAATYANAGLVSLGNGNAMNGIPNPTKLGAMSHGPDYYDPSSPDGPEPSELQTSGPEKCTRLLNSWLYKCALSPL